MERVLPVEDAEVSAFAKKAFVKQGMVIMEKATVKKLDRAPDGKGGGTVLPISNRVARSKLISLTR